jgi:NADP-dependent 3-hydroxy acid dehydrogenase YdfG
MIIKGKRVLVTGANGGIGQAIARALHSAGAQVVISGRRADALEALASEIDAQVVIADLSRRDDVTRCMQEAGMLDILVANAALPATGSMLAYDSDQIDRALDVNLRAPIMMARHCLPGMVERRRGQIVFISSISAKVAAPGAAMYCASKFGLRGFSLALREDLHGTGVGVTSVLPGFIRDAGMFADTKVRLPTGTGTRSPEQVAKAVLTAVRSNPAEITVAALEQRFGALLGGIYHPFVAWFQRLLGAESTAKRIVNAQAHKR